MEYSNNFGSQFPSSLISVGTKKDIDNTISDLVSLYYSCIDAGDVGSAHELYLSNKAKLDSYILNAAYVNKLEEELFNIGLCALRQVTTIFSDGEPIEQLTDGYWYQDYN